MIQFIHIYKSSIKYFLQCLTRNHDMNIWNWNTIRESFKKKGNGKFHGENQREVIKEQLQNSFLDSSFITLFKELQQDGGPSDLLNLSTLYNHCCGDQHHPLQISEDNSNDGKCCDATEFDQFVVHNILDGWCGFYNNIIIKH